ncbi:uncharacterized protein F5891DRAFT_1127521 [Suillus fuscotomentosus]|uniref:Uncharacterized protein n=1 Tax=Suillus fuscotomentosus TaxID=1912939 RepID=A0AAD4EBN3_9AGAM|nr:uncharacterized protein F5891DRAFT_1127521 [Suillus fuscotomentosus]KAG1902986.1 hypothetical protein F5891DRAFT_1127521 [Suillus fuscotomentosus]
MSEAQESQCSQRRKSVDALQLGPRKRPSATDPLVHYGRHFGRTIHALCNFQALLTNGILRMGELAEIPEENFTAEERREHRIFQELLKSVAGLEERLMQGGDDEVDAVAELFTKGASGARGDDTKSLKGSVLDWITPKGQSLVPPLARNVKIDRGFHHERTGALLCPAGLDWSNAETKTKLRNGEIIVTGDQWPLFLYTDYHYDPEDPWNGLLRSALLSQAYKHVFTSPSSVDKEPKATRSGNARIHGMTRVTLPSIAYIATQVRFSLTSSPVFSRTDTVTDSERFYNSILEVFEDPDEKQEVDDLVVWWNRQIFPSYSSAQRPLVKNSALARIREKRARMKEPGSVPDGSSGSM